jgi:predicted transcriptional regulator
MDEEETSFNKYVLKYKEELEIMCTKQKDEYEKRSEEINQLMCHKTEINKLKRKISDLEEKNEKISEELAIEKEKNNLKDFYEKFNDNYYQSKIKRLQSHIQDLNKRFDLNYKDLEMKYDESESESLNYNLFCIEHILEKGTI